MFTIFYRNKRLLILTIILIFVWGISSYFTLPRLEDPELVSRNAVVKTFYPGADAERVEALVTEKIEDKLTEIEEIDNYRSASRTGSSIINIELQDNVTKEQVDSVWTRVRNKLDEVKVKLPSNIREPELEEIKVKAYALIAALTWQQDDQVRLTGLDRTAIAQQLDTALEGVVGGSVLESTEELPVRVRLRNRDRANLSEITSLDLLARSPRLDSNQNNPLSVVPLSSLGKLQLKPELAQITRYNGQRVNTIQGFLTAGVLPAEILNQFQAILSQNNFDV